jgi:hypothetical protein
MRPCLHHDPITVVGARQCGTCAAVGYPLDAIWVSDSLILVTYDASCQHVKSGTVVIDPASIVTTDLELARYVRGRRCAGVNARRRPCRAYAQPGSDFCWSHRGQPDSRGA